MLWIRYSCFRCMKTFPIIRIKMVVSIVQSIGNFFSQRQVKKIRCYCCVRTVTWLSRFEAYPENCSHSLTTKVGEIKRIEYGWLVWQKNSIKQIRCYDWILVKFWKIDMRLKYIKVHGRCSVENKYFSLIHSLARCLASYIGATEEFCCFFQSYQLKCSLGKLLFTPS